MILKESFLKWFLMLIIQALVLYNLYPKFDLTIISNILTLMSVRNGDF